MRAHLETAVIALTPEEIMRVRGIVLDQDPAAALKFLRECLDKKISEVVDRPRCRPVFELPSGADKIGPHE